MFRHNLKTYLGLKPYCLEPVNLVLFGNNKEKGPETKTHSVCRTLTTFSLNLDTTLFSTSVETVVFLCVILKQT